MRRRELLSIGAAVGLSGCAGFRATAASPERYDDVGDFDLAWPTPRGDVGNRAFQPGRVLPDEPDRLWTESVPFADRSSAHPPVGSGDRFSILEGRERARTYPSGDSIETDGRGLEFLSVVDGSLLATGYDTIRRIEAGETTANSTLDNDLGIPRRTRDTVVVAERSGTGGVYGLDPETLEPAWTAKTLPLAGAAITDAGDIVAATVLGSLLVLDGAGNERWDRYVDGHYCKRLPASDGDVVYAITHDRTGAESIVTAVDAERGTTVFERRVEGDLSDPCLGPSYVAVTGDDGTLYLLDRADGTVIETVDAEADGDAVGPTARLGFGPTADEELVYQTLPDGRLRAIDPERGTQRWALGLEEPIVSQPTLGADSILVRTSGGVAVLS